MLEIELLWWHWLITGALLLCLDLFLINSFFVMWFGLGVLPVVLLLLVFPATPVWAQAFIWMTSCSGLIFSWRFFRKNDAVGENSVNAMLGITGIVTAWHEGKGQVRLQRPYNGHDVWEAISQETITTGDTCKIAKVDAQATVVTLHKA